MRNQVCADSCFRLHRPEEAMKSKMADKYVRYAI